MPRRRDRCRDAGAAREKRGPCLRRSLESRSDQSAAHPSSAARSELRVRTKPEEEIPAIPNLRRHASAELSRRLLLGRLPPDYGVVVVVVVVLSSDAATAAATAATATAAAIMPAVIPPAAAAPAAPAPAPAPPAPPAPVPADPPEGACAKALPATSTEASKTAKIFLISYPPYSSSLTETGSGRAN